jgi:hypothetical protein
MTAGMVERRPVRSGARRTRRVVLFVVASVVVSSSGVHVVSAKLELRGTTRGLTDVVTAGTTLENVLGPGLPSAVAERLAEIGAVDAEVDGNIPQPNVPTPDEQSAGSAVSTDLCHGVSVIAIF